MKRIAVVCQRYGREVAGGSEAYARMIAERLATHFRTDVITTTALDSTTWAPYYPAGRSEENGVQVLRFPVRSLRSADFDAYTVACLRRPGLRREAVWFRKQGPYAPDAVRYLRRHRRVYAAVLFVTYLYYLTVKGLPEVRDRAIFIPTAHDEPYLRFRTYERLFRMPRRFIFLTEEERALVHGRFWNEAIPYDVLGAGAELPGRPDAARFRKKYGIREPYLLYTGRITAGKNCGELLRYYAAWKRRNASPLRLVLLGRGDLPVPAHPDILAPGFVSEYDKADALAGASAFVMPSQYESLSLSTLEALAAGTPVLVNGSCDVLRGHCLRSGAGLYYRSYAEFEGALCYLLAHPAETAQMRQNGKAYIAAHYRWDGITEALCRAVRSI